MSSPILKSKKQAVGIVRAAVKSGRLIRPDSCSGCGRRVEVHAHHDDYSKPLDVRWLCRRCHALEHASEPEWAVAARVLRGEGKTYEEIGELLGRDTTSVYKHA